MSSTLFSKIVADVVHSWIWHSQHQVPSLSEEKATKVMEDLRFIIDNNELTTDVKKLNIESILEKNLGIPGHQLYILYIDIFHGIINPWLISNALVLANSKFTLEDTLGLLVIGTWPFTIKESSIGMWVGGFNVLEAFGFASAVNIDLIYKNYYSLRINYNRFYDSDF